MLTAALRLAISVFTVMLSIGPSAHCSNCQLQYLSLSVDFPFFILIKRICLVFVQSRDVAGNGVITTEECGRGENTWRTGKDTKRAGDGGGGGGTENTDRG